MICGICAFCIKIYSQSAFFCFFMSLEFLRHISTYTFKTYLQIYVHKASELWNFYRALYRQQCVFMLYEICIAVSTLNWCSQKRINKFPNIFTMFLIACTNRNNERLSSANGVDIENIRRTITLPHKIGMTNTVKFILCIKY